MQVCYHTKMSLLLTKEKQVKNSQRLRTCQYLFGEMLQKSFVDFWALKVIEFLLGFVIFRVRCVFKCVFDFLRRHLVT